MAKPSGSNVTGRGRTALAVIASLVAVAGAVAVFSAAPSSAVVGPSTSSLPPRTTVPRTTVPHTTVPRPTTTQLPTTTEAPTTTAAPATTAATLPPETTDAPIAPPTNPQIPVTAVPDADAEPFEPPCAVDALDDYYTATKDEVFTIPSEAGLGVNDQLCPNGSSYTIDNLTDPANGTVVKTPNEYGAFEYTPDPGFTGSDTFTYSLLANDVEVDTATAHITVTDNCSVVAFEDGYVVPFETPIAEAAPGFVTNDTLECEPYTVVITSPPYGYLIHNGGGGFDYTPNSGFYGFTKFSYEIRDANQQVMANSVVTILVEDPVCVANDVAYATSVDTTLTVVAPGVFSNDFVCPHFFALGVAQLPTHGAVILAFDGSFEYNPDPGYVGPDSFTYNIVILALPFNEVADTATVTIDVTSTPSPTTTTTATTTPSVTTTTTVPTDSTSTTTPGTPTTAPAGGTLPPTGFLPATR